MTRIGDARRAAKYLLVILIGLYPCSRLLVPQTFYFDWMSHTSFISYFSMMESKGSLPTAMSFDNFIGWFMPIFYGYLFFPLLGLAGVVLSAEVALRAFAIVLTVYQAFLTWRLLQPPVGGKLALAWTAIAVWSSYALVNLYSRSAIPEFFSATMLTLAVLHLCVFFDQKTVSRSSQLHLSLALFWAVFVVGTHPITAVLGAIMLVILVCCLMWVSRVHPSYLRETILSKRIVIQIVIALLCVAPWFYATLTFANQLYVGPNAPLHYFPGIDTIAARLWPYPFDFRSLDAAPRDLSTPFLYGQINVALALLAAALAVTTILPLARARHAIPKRLLISTLASFGVGAFALLISLPISSDLPLPKIMTAAQFGYRYITYVNLALLLCVVSILRTCGRLETPARTALTPPTVAALLLAAIAVFANVANPSLGDKAIGRTHLADFAGPEYLAPSEAALPQTIDRWKSDMRSMTRLPVPYLPRQYSTERAFQSTGPRAVQKTALPVRSGAYAGPVTAECGADQALITNVVAFPWNHLTVDGVEARTDRLVQLDGFLGIVCDSPKHTIGYIDGTPAWFRGWLFAARILFGTWALILLFLVLSAISRRFRAHNPLRFQRSH